MKNERKHIEEMAWDICDIPRHPSYKSCMDCNCYAKCHAMYYAKRAHDAGYRKQVEGEWLERKGERWIGSEVCETYTYYNCSICEGYSRRRTNHCPNCGAKMKGGA